MYTYIHNSYIHNCLTTLPVQPLSGAGVGVRGEEINHICDPLGIGTITMVLCRQHNKFEMSQGQTVKASLKRFARCSSSATTSDVNEGRAEQFHEQ